MEKKKKREEGEVGKRGRTIKGKKVRTGITAQNSKRGVRRNFLGGEHTLIRE